MPALNDLHIVRGKPDRFELGYDADEAGRIYGLFLTEDAAEQVLIERESTGASPEKSLEIFSAEAALFPDYSEINSRIEYQGGAEASIYHLQLDAVHTVSAHTLFDALRGPDPTVVTLAGGFKLPRVAVMVVLFDMGRPG